MPDPILTDWAFVKPGAMITDANGDDWHVGDRATDLPRIALWCVPAGHSGKAQWVTRNAGDEVVILDTSLDRATAVLYQTLGFGTIMEMEPLPVIQKPGVVALWKAHLQHHHCEYAGHGEKSVKNLIELHALSHASPKSGWLPHIHTHVPARRSR